jgi:hypothetical protein
MARRKKHTNHKFYTKVEVAIKLIDLIDLSKYDCIIEPSAGKGSFSKNIIHSNLVALDIDPEDESINKLDWFNFKWIEGESRKKVLVIGNPPFGNQGALALNFIKKCDELEVDTIAFILPKSFKKETIKRRIPHHYHLSNEIDLDDDSYTLLNNNYSVPSIFQIWDRKMEIRKKVELKTKSNLINFVKKSENPDYSLRRVGFYAGKVDDEIDTKSEQSHYYIKSSPEIKDFLKYYKWDHNNTSGPRSIGKGEIIKIIEEYKKGEQNLFTFSNQH